MSIQSSGNELRSDDTMRRQENGDLQDILNIFNSDDISSGKKTIQPGDVVNIDDNLTITVNKVIQLDADVIFDFLDKFNEAQFWWNHRVLVKKGIIDQFDEKATVEKKLDLYKTGDYDSMLSALTKVQFVEGSFNDRETGKPNTKRIAVVSKKHPNIVFLNSNHPYSGSMRVKYHELMHVMQLNGVVEYVPKPPKDRDRNIANERAEAKLLFSALGPEQQAVAVAAYAAGVRWLTLTG